MFDEMRLDGLGFSLPINGLGFCVPTNGLGFRLSICLFIRLSIDSK